MKKNKILSTVAFICGTAWFLTAVQWGVVFTGLPSTSGDSVNGWFGLFLGLSIIVSAFVISRTNYKLFNLFGAFGCFALSYVLKFIENVPVIPLVCLFAIFVGMLCTSILFMLVFGSSQENQSRFGALYVAGFLIMFVVIGWMREWADPQIFFLIITFLPAVCAVFTHYFNFEEDDEKDKEYKPFPTRLCTVLGVVIAVGYFDLNILQSGYSDALRIGLANPISLSVIAAVTIIATVAVAQRKGLFTVIYSALFLMGITYLFLGFFGANALQAASTAFATGALLFNLFACVFVPYISVRYGTNPWVFRSMMVAFAAGAGLGRACGKIALQADGQTQNIFPLTFLIAFAVGMAAMPTLVKLIEKELAGGCVPMSSDGTKKGEAGLHDEASESERMRQALQSMNTQCSPGERLTPRELEIALLLLERYDYDTIARRLCISINTLKAHIGHIYGKWNVQSKKELIFLAADYLRREEKPAEISQKTS